MKNILTLDQKKYRSIPYWARFKVLPFDVESRSKMLEIGIISFSFDGDEYSITFQTEDQMVKFIMEYM